MLSSRQIDKIIKNIYPTSTLSRKARKHFRLAMREEIEEYLDEYPNATYEVVQQHYENSEILMTLQESSAVHITKIIVYIGLLLVIVCAIFFSISNGWTPPTYNI